MTPEKELQIAMADTKDAMAKFHSDLLDVARIDCTTEQIDNYNAAMDRYKESVETFINLDEPVADDVVAYMEMLKTTEEPVLAVSTVADTLVSLEDIDSECLDILGSAFVTYHTQTMINKVMEEATEASTNAKS